jgi:hypothetical protein
MLNVKKQALQTSFRAGFGEVNLIPGEQYQVLLKSAYLRALVVVLRPLF